MDAGVCPMVGVRLQRKTTTKTWSFCCTMLDVSPPVEHEINTRFRLVLVTAGIMEIHNADGKMFRIRANRCLASQCSTDIRNMGSVYGRMTSGPEPQSKIWLIVQQTRAIERPAQYPNTKSTKLYIVLSERARTPYIVIFVICENIFF
jgi:hypothetical protein